MRTVAPDPATPHNPLIHPPIPQKSCPTVPKLQVCAVWAWDSRAYIWIATEFIIPKHRPHLSERKEKNVHLFKIQTRNVCHDFQHFFIAVHVIFDNIQKRFKFSIDGQNTLAELEGGLTVTDAQTGYQKGFCIERSPSCGF